MRRVMIEDMPSVPKDPDSLVTSFFESIENKNVNHLSFTSSLIEQARIKEVWNETTTHLTNVNMGFTALEE